MIDFNCDIAQSYGVYQNDEELKVAQYASSVNISAGFHAGDPMAIRKAFLFAKDNNVALGAHIGYPDIQGFGKRKMDLEKDELIALVTYQIGAIEAYSKTFDLSLEQVRCHGALKDAVNNDEETAKYLAEAVKNINPWLNLIVQKEETKDFIQSLGVKCALEVEYDKDTDLAQISNKFGTVHFKSLEDIKYARNIIEPTPINYNRVQGQI